jgi:aminoglycoside phosphotransferase (APT) family kinase protein
MGRGRDPRLEAAIRGVGAWRGRGVDVTPVSIGHDERHYLVEVGDELSVLRLTSPSGNRPYTDPSVELEVARAAASAGVAPDVVASMPQLGCLITRFASGRHLTPRDLDRDGVVPSLVGSVRALHSCPLPNGERSAFREARDLRRAAIARGTSMPGSEPAATEAIRSIAEATLAPGRAAVTIHGDLTPSSLFLDGDQVRIVDYRWAGAGDPFEDLGSLAEHLALTADQGDAMLQLYFGAVDDAGRSRLMLMRMAATYLAAMRTLSGSPPASSAEAAAAERQLATVAEGSADGRFDRWLGALEPAGRPT